MNDEELLSVFREAVGRLALSDADVSAVSGLAPVTVRLVRTGGAIPKQPRARRAFVSFVELASKAKARSDLHLGEVRT